MTRLYEPHHLLSDCPSCSSLARENAELRRSYGAERDHLQGQLSTTHGQIAEMCRALNPNAVPDAWGLNEAITSLKAKLERAREALKSAANCLELEAEADGAIVDTIWLSEAETLVDFLRMASATPEAVTAPAQAGDAQTASGLFCHPCCGGINTHLSRCDKQEPRSYTAKEVETLLDAAEMRAKRRPSPENSGEG